MLVLTNATNQPRTPPPLQTQPQASRFQDPVTGEDVTMLIQTDVTGRVAAERALRAVLDAEHKLLEEVFPRQVLEAMTVSAIRAIEKQSAPGSGATGGGGGGQSDGGTTAASAGPGAVGGLLNPKPAGSPLKIALHHEQVGLLDGMGLVWMFGWLLGWVCDAQHSRSAILHQPIPTFRRQVSILFADIVGFTSMAKSHPADVVMELLNDLFTR